MTTTPDPQAMRKYALEYLRRYITNIDHGDVLDEMLCDTRFAHLMTGDEDRDIATLDPIAAEITDQAKVLAGALSWPTEQPQVGGSDDAFAMVAADCPAGPARAVAEHWFSHAALISDSVGSPEWHAVADMTRRILDLMDAEQGEQDGDARVPAEVLVRLNAWLAGRQVNVHPEILTTSVVAEPRDRTTAAWAIAESDVRAVVAALDARDAKAGEQR